MMVFFAGLWPIVSKVGLAWLLVAGLVAVWYFLPFWLPAKLKNAPLALAVMIFLTTASYAVGVRDGETRVQDEWTASVSAEQSRGEKDRAAAERSVASERPSELRDDRYNRDGGAAGK